ncbi:MAG: hypothetical protein E6296_05845 [Anaerococcus vaginalis]|nr:hypothetical protein [Anaerococcus vaginalis]
MKKKLILALCLSLVFTGCAKKEKIKENNISSNRQTSEKSEEKNSNLSNVSVDKNENSAKKPLSIEEIKKAMVDIGAFDKKFVDGLKDEDIKKYEKKADELREKTGFWNKLILFFNQVGKDNPNSSKQYPDISVNEVEETWIYSGDENTDNYKNARNYLSQRGFDASKVPNGILKEIFFNVYDENKLKSYDEQIDKACQKLKEKFPNGYNETKNETPKNKTSKNENQESGQMKKFSEKKQDYDDFRKQLVELYGFSQSSVEKITNEDIDLANYRAEKKLKETGYGDIGLIINEIAKMYPNSSTMYPGDDK